jgi:hypothetical protein
MMVALEPADREDYVVVLVEGVCGPDGTDVDSSADNLDSSGHRPKSAAQQVGLSLRAARRVQGAGNHHARGVRVGPPHKLRDRTVNGEDDVAGAGRRHGDAEHRVSAVHVDEVE